jgi:hypothetical protein
LLLVAGVEEAERGVVFVAEHTAAASVGEGELAEIGIGGIGAFCSHGHLSRKGATKQGGNEVTKGRRVARTADFMKHDSRIITACQLLSY